MDLRKNEVTRVELKIEKVGNSFGAEIVFGWKLGKDTTLKTPVSFESIEEALKEASHAIVNVLPDIGRLIAEAMAENDNESGELFIGRAPRQMHFEGEVGELKCSCHKGEFRVFVYAIEGLDRTFIKSVKVRDEEEGVMRMNSIVMDVVGAHLRDLGLNISDAEISVNNGPFDNTLH